MIDVDWMVPHNISGVTNCNQQGNFITLDRNNNELVLVGSAEQGFIKAVVDGRVEFDRKYMSISPCFRRGDTGPLNQEWFIKLELNYVSLTDSMFFGVLGSDAKELFNELTDYTKDFFEVNITRDDTSFDINGWHHTHKSVEVGSYGVREIKGLTANNFLLHYGTGLALPRFQLFTDN